MNNIVITANQKTSYCNYRHIQYVLYTPSTKKKNMYYIHHE